MAKFYLVVNNSIGRRYTVSGPWNSKGQANRELRAYAGKGADPRVEAR